MENLLYLLIVMGFAALPVILPLIFMEMTADKEYPLSDKRRKLARHLGWLLGLSLLALFVYFIFNSEEGHLRRSIRVIVQLVQFLIDFLK